MQSPNVHHLSSAFSSNGGQGKKFVAKGHDSQLQDAQYGKLPTTITTLRGDTVRGTVVKRDKYTITLRLAEGSMAGQDEIFYKHAIESVMVQRPASLNS